MGLQETLNSKSNLVRASFSFKWVLKSESCFIAARYVAHETQSDYKDKSQTHIPWSVIDFVLSPLFVHVIWLGTVTWHILIERSQSEVIEQAQHYHHLPFCSAFRARAEYTLLTTRADCGEFIFYYSHLLDDNNPQNTW